jgi:hypothetical protein
MIKRRKTLDHEDAAFMKEARGYCMTADFANMYPAIDRRINYGDECRIDPQTMVTQLGSSMPNMKINDPREADLARELERNPIYHHADLVQVIE